MCVRVRAHVCMCVCMCVCECVCVYACICIYCFFVLVLFHFAFHEKMNKDDMGRFYFCNAFSHHLTAVYRRFGSSREII